MSGNTGGDDKGGNARFLHSMFLEFSGFAGLGLLLRKALANVVFERVQLLGGEFAAQRRQVGLLLLASVNPALTHLHVEAYWEKAIQGLIILLAVAADGWRTRQNR